MADCKVQQNNLVHAIVHNLKKQPMPSNAKNVTAFRSTSNKQLHKETILPSTGDKRHKYGNDKEDMSLNFKYGITQHRASPPIQGDITEYIIQLHLDYNGTKYVGTGTIINIKNKKIYILTAAHNVVNIKKIENKTCYADNIWFSFKNKKLSANKFYVYGKYTQKQMGNDMAIIECCVNFPFIAWNRFPRLSINIRAYCFTVFGYPGEKKGELWGIDGCNGEPLNTDVLWYKGNTTGGQSGSAVCSIYSIIGVHTHGGVDKNYGTRFTADKLKWVESISAAWVDTDDWDDW